MKVFEVSQVNRYIKDLFSRDLLLNDLWVKGEVSNFKHHSSGHMYFTIKDDSSTLKCVMFQTQAARMRFALSDGMRIIAGGRIGIYERDGQYQLYCAEIQPDGLGALYAAFEQLKVKLQKEGLFSIECKKSLPILPQNIGVITSKTGSVIRDIINVSCRRFPNIRIVLCPVAVQGDTSAEEISNAIRVFNKLKNADVIIVARGGGSLEDLWAFNQEIVARTVFESDIPIVSAVGHETDFTICDMAADIRAPTPSAAAEIVVPEKKELSNRIKLMRKRILNAQSKAISNARFRIESIMNRHPFRQPFDRVYQSRMAIDVLKHSLTRGINSKTFFEKARLDGLSSRLNSLNPHSVLSRGYCIVYQDRTNKLIKSVEHVYKNDKINIQFIDGKANCEIINLENGYE